MIAVDLPGFGATPPLPGEVSIATLRDAVVALVDEQGLAGIDHTRTLLFSQFSAHSWAPSPKLVLRELQGYATAPSFDAALMH